MCISVLHSLYMFVFVRDCSSALFLQHVYFMYIHVHATLFDIQRRGRAIL